MNCDCKNTGPSSSILWLCLAVLALTFALGFVHARLNRVETVTEDLVDDYQRRLPHRPRPGTPARPTGAIGAKAETPPK